MGQFYDEEINVRREMFYHDCSFSMSTPKSTL